MKRLFFCLMISSLLIPLFTGCATVEDKQYDLDESTEPVPYEDDEFPDWMQDLRRGEIIFAGSLPFTILISNAGFGVYNMLTSGAYDITTVTSSSVLSNDEKLQILGIGAGISAGIALTDFILGLFEEEDELE